MAFAGTWTGMVAYAPMGNFPFASVHVGDTDGDDRIIQEFPQKNNYGPYCGVKINKLGTNKDTYRKDH